MLTGTCLVFYSLSFHINEHVYILCDPLYHNVPRYICLFSTIRCLVEQQQACHMFILPPPLPTEVM